MVYRPRHVLLSLFVTSTVAAGLTLPLAGAAQNKPVPTPAGAKAKPRPGDPVRFQEAQALRSAFMSLASANHDYDGHRWKAMMAAKESFHVLHEAIRKGGTPQQKAGTEALRAEIAAAEAAARQRGPVHEAQGASDAAMRQAGETLAQIRASMAQHKHQTAMGHVDRALHQIRIALNIR